jgi:hypothetical protein
VQLFFDNIMDSVSFQYLSFKKLVNTSQADMAD